MPKLKILEISNGLGVGGAGRTLQTFCRYLDKEKFDVKIACVFEGGKRAEELSKEGFTVTIFKGDVSRLKDYLRQEKFDVLHIHRRGAFEPHWQEILKDRFVPYVVETNVFAEFDEKTNPFIDVHLFKSMMMLNERYPDHSWPKNRVLYNPVDVKLFEKFKLSPEEIMSRKSQLGIKDNETVIGKVGARAAMEKWSWLVTDMFPLLLKEIPNVKMILQAAPAEVVKKLKQTSYVNNLIFLPETEDESLQASYYQLLDVFVHSSKIGEAFGNTLNEAMVWKKPIVVNSTPWADNGQLEQVEPGQNGYIANTPRSFAAAVRFLLADRQKSQEMGEVGHHKVMTEYSPEKIVANLENIFKVSDDFKYFPSRNDIISYRSEYRERLKEDYLQSTFLEYVNFYLISAGRPALKGLKKFLLGV